MKKIIILPGVKTSKNLDFFKLNLAKVKNQTIYISHQFIDAHIHLSSHNKKYALKQIDGIFGYYALIDAGSHGILDLIDQKIKTTRPLMYYFVNFNKHGLETKHELALAKKAWIKENLQLEKKWPSNVIGYKFRLSQESVQNNSQIINILRDFPTKKTKMFHIGSPPPYFQQWKKLINNHDIITHPFNKKSQDFTFVPCYYDLGWGQASFSYKIFLQKKNQFQLDSISSDFHQESKQAIKNLLNIPSYFIQHFGLEKTIDLISISPFEKYIHHNKNKYYRSYCAFVLKKTNTHITDSDKTRLPIKTSIVPMAMIDEKGVITWKK